MLVVTLKLKRKNEPYPTTSSLANSLRGACGENALDVEIRVRNNHFASPLEHRDQEAGEARAGAAADRVGELHLRMAAPSVSAVFRFALLPFCYSTFRRFAVLALCSFYFVCRLAFCRFRQHIVSKIMFSVSKATLHARFVPVGDVLHGLRAPQRFRQHAVSPAAPDPGKIIITIIIIIIIVVIIIMI